MGKFIKDLGGGLHIKAGTIEDVDSLSDYNAKNLSDEGPDQPEEFVRDWTVDLMSHHPTSGPEDFIFVEDTKKDKIVSSLCLISQTWAYEDIPFDVGRVEMVSTHRDYRRRGLVRTQFEVLHDLSQAKGEKMTVITGIPYFYRQFGYEMTINLGGSRRGSNRHVPKLKDGEDEPFTIRLAGPEDIPFIKEMYDRGRRRSMISCLRDDITWRYEMLDQPKIFHTDMTIIEAPDGEPVGFIWHNNKVHSSRLALFCYELKAGISWSAVTPTVIRYLKSKGVEFASTEDDKEWESFSLYLGVDHPAYNVAERCLPETDPPYAWYIRFPDLVDFLKTVSPVLERRLQQSDYAGYSGELLLDFHRSGIKMQIDKGSIPSIEDWIPSTETRGDLAFPDLTFLQLVTGYRSFDELRDFYPDCYRRKKSEASTLINTLFPKKNSNIQGIV